MYIYICMYIYIYASVKIRGARVNPAGWGDFVSDPLKARPFGGVGP